MYSILYSIKCSTYIVHCTPYTLRTYSIAYYCSTKQYVGEPISCWCPAQFTDNHEDFTNKICWVTDTYYVPRSQRLIPDVCIVSNRNGFIFHFI